MLGHFTEGLRDPGHTSEVIDLYAITIFGKNAYDDGIRDAIGKVIDDWAFRFPGIQDVEHVYFYAVTAATPELVKRYFEQAYQLGRDFERPAANAGGSTSAA